MFARLKHPDLDPARRALVILLVGLNAYASFLADFALVDETGRTTGWSLLGVAYLAAAGLWVVMRPGVLRWIVVGLAVAWTTLVGFVGLG